MVILGKLILEICSCFRWSILLFANSYFSTIGIGGIPVIVVSTSVDIIL